MTKPQDFSKKIASVVRKQSPKVRIKPVRIKYFFCVVITVLLGLLSREIPFLPLFFGDALYAIMMYFIMRSLFPERSMRTIAIIALVVCFCIEISQLCQTGLIEDLRNMPLGHYILGRGFLWTDLLAYSIGVMLTFGIDSLFRILPKEYKK